MDALEDIEESVINTLEGATPELADGESLNEEALG